MTDELILNHDDLRSLHRHYINLICVDWSRSLWLKEVVRATAARRVAQWEILSGAPRASSSPTDGASG